MNNIKTDLSIVGLGAASYAAALYSVRYQIPTIMIGSEFGGETATGGLIENYPGVPEIDGYDLMLNMKEQVEKYNIKTIDENALNIEIENNDFLIKCSDSTIVKSKSVILGIGRERRKLNLKNEENLVGKGVSYCSTCDAPLYKDKVTAVVGGGNAAIEGALLLSRYSTKVYLIYRGEKIFRPEPVLLKHLDESKNITVLLNTNVTKINGNEETGLSSIETKNDIQEDVIKIDGLFIEIGADPRLEIPHQLGLEINKSTNEVHVNNLMETNLKGIFAAGDLTDASGNLKQTVTAAGQGAISALSAYNYLNQ